MSNPKEDRSQTIQVQINMKTGESVSSQIENDNNSELFDKGIAIKIHEIVSNVCTKQVDNTIIELKEFLLNSDFVGAIKLIRTSEKSGVFMGRPKIELLEKILEIDKTKLPDEELKDFYRYIIIVSTKTSRFDLVYEHLKNYFLERDEIQDNRLKIGLKLSIANGAAQLGKLELAYKLFNDLILDPETDSINRAWAYSGLCSINDIEDPITKNHFYSAAELFLESGNRKKAVDCFMKLSSIWENQDIDKSLGLIDKAIGLLDIEDNIESNYVSGILHQKAFILTNKDKDLEAVKTIKKAIKIREGLIGIEYELYSSYSLGKMIAIKINDEKFEKECIQKAKDIEALISHETFYLQKKVESFLKSKKIEDEIIQKIENGSSKTLKFSLYLGQALLDTTSVTEKLEKLEKATQIEGRWGLLVFQIITCKGYTNNKYLPIVPIIEKTSMKKEGSIIPIPDKDYKENTDSITTSTIGYPKGSINLESENNLSFLNPENETVVLSSKFYSVAIDQNGQNIYIIQGGTNVHGFKNGPYGTKTGKENKNNDKVEPKKYFPLFISIINKISENLKLYSPKFECVNQRLEKQEEFCPINLSKLKNTKIDQEIIYFYFLIFKVQNKYFSIIEKQITHNNNRLWLYSFDSFAEPKNQMIKDLIDRYFYKKEPSDPKRFAPDNKMNHLHAGSGYQSQISDDEAIVSQANKISNRIKKCLD